MNDEAIVKLILGVRGCGKTVKLLRLLRPIRRCLIINTLNREGFTDGVVFNTVPDLRTFWLSVYRGNFRLIFSPQHGDNEKTCREVGELCKLAEACGDMTVAIEELNVIFAAQRKPVEFNRLVFSGREPGIELIGVAQRPKGFGPELASQAKEAFVFHTHEPDAVTFLKNWMGKDAAEAIRTLTGHQYLHWSFEDGANNYTIKEDEFLPDMR